MGARLRLSHCLQYAEDLDLDGDPDVVLLQDDERVVVINQGGGSFSAPRLLDTVPGLADTLIADLDRDGVPDLLTLAWDYT